MSCCQLLRYVLHKCTSNEYTCTYNKGTFEHFDRFIVKNYNNDIDINGQQEMLVFISSKQ